MNINYLCQEYDKIYKMFHRKHNLWPDCDIVITAYLKKVFILYLHAYITRVC